MYQESFNGGLKGPKSDDFLTKKRTILAKHTFQFSIDMQLAISTRIAE